MSTVMEVLDKAEQYVTAHFQNHVDDDSCAYHNLQHTREVVAAAKEIGAASGLTEEEIDIVVTAAGFMIRAFQTHGKTTRPTALKRLSSLTSNWSCLLALVSR